MAFRISSSRYYFAIKNVSRIVRAGRPRGATVVNKQREAFPITLLGRADEVIE